MKRKFFIIQSRGELDFFKIQKKFKKYEPILWFPDITKKKDNKLNYISDFEKIKRRKVDIDLMKKFYQILFEIDKEVLKIFNKMAKVSYYYNAGHSFKNLLDVYLNEVNRFQLLSKKSSEIAYFKKKNIASYDFVDLICENSFLSKKIRVKKFNYNKGTTKYFFEKNYFNLVTFLNIKNFSLFQIFNIVKNLLFYFKKNLKYQILVTKFDRKDSNFFNEDNFKNIRFLRYEDIIFFKKKIFIDNIKKNKILKNFFNNKKINFNFLNSKNFNHKKILLKILVDNLESIINVVNYNYNKSLYLKKKYNLNLVMHKYETLDSITISEVFNNSKIKSIFLSHGGTIGIYKNWPTVSYYYLKNKKNFIYLTFSKIIKKEMEKIQKKIKGISNIKVIPYYRHLPLKELNNSDLPKKINKIAYFFSPTYGLYESKVGMHNDINLNFFRRDLFEYFKEIKNLQINCKFAGSKKLVGSILQDLENQKNINIISNRTPLNKIFKENDLIITEVNSTTLIEAQYSKKFVLALVKSYPSFLSNSEKEIKRRVFLFSKKENFFKKLDYLLKKKTNSIDYKRLKDRKFLENYYSYSQINKKNIIKKFKSLFINSI